MSAVGEVCLPGTSAGGICSSGLLLLRKAGTMFVVGASYLSLLQAVVTRCGLPYVAVVSELAGDGAPVYGVEIGVPSTGLRSVLAGCHRCLNIRSTVKERFIASFSLPMGSDSVRRDLSQKRRNQQVSSLASKTNAEAGYDTKVVQKEAEWQQEASAWRIQQRVR